MSRINAVTEDHDFQEFLSGRALEGLDHLLGLAPDMEPIAAGEIAALVRLIRDACPCRAAPL